MKPDSKFKFGEWLPDQADLDNPGSIEARNVLWTGSTYQPYQRLDISGGPINGTLPVAAFRASGSGASNLYVAGISGSSSFLSAAAGAGGSWTNVTNVGGNSLSNTWSFTQYKANVIATNGGAEHPQVNNLDLAPFVKLTGAYGDAPSAKVCGVIGQFVMLGNLPGVGSGAGTTLLRWSGIDAPLDWPAPNSAQAIAEQSGQQYLDWRLGAIEAIGEGDQWGVILMDGGAVRLTYVGGNTVFQFDTIYRGPVLLGPNASIKVAGKYFSVGSAGFVVTDGTTVIPIGDSRVDRWFQNNADFAYPWAFTAGVDYRRKIIYWSFPLLGNSGVPNHWIAYNYLEDKFSHGDDGVKTYVRAEEAWVSQYGLQGFDVGGHVGTFTGTPGTATITSPEVEIIPGKRALVSSVTPQISGTTALTARIGTRTLQSDAVTYTAPITPDPNTGDCNQMVDGRYLRVEFDVVGNFSQAMGGSFDAQPSSEF